MALRNSIVTYATLLGHEARAAGVNACWDLPEAKRRFSAASFRNALRRLRPKRRGSAAAETEPAPGETRPAEPAPVETKPAEPGAVEPAPV
ncbi:hypothetical protein [Sorangium sp. So ce542]|uniref:hypothetical protein n=1 Tax=Sorangium sp. So ce542 TaxID=3133316 RepID=UPI003F5FB13C